MPPLVRWRCSVRVSMNGSNATHLQRQRPLSGGMSRSQLATERDDIQKRIARALLVVAEPSASVRAPIIVLQGDKNNPYLVIERHMTPEVLAGCERFWRLARSLHEPNIETWRPRVNGVQLKALYGVRLPDTPAEWGAVRSALEAVGPAFRPDSSPAALLTDLMTLADECAAWWDTRNKPAAGSKRPPSRPSSASGPAQKRQPPANRSHSPSPVFRPPSLPDILAHHQQPPFMGMAAGLWPASTPFGAMPLLPGLLNPQPAFSGGILNGIVISPDDSGSGMLGGMPAAASMQRHDSSNSGHSMQQQHTHHQQPHTPPPQVVMSPVAPPLNLGGPPASGAEFALPFTSGSTVKQDQKSQTRVQPSPMSSEAPAAGQQQQVEAILRELERRIISLNVGGTCVTTTAATLAAIEGSFLSKLVFIQPAQASPRAQTSDFFIDRDGKLFEHVIAYLRAVQYQEPEPDLPGSAKDLALLLREAKYYALPGLAQRIQEALDNHSAPPSSHRLTIDIRVDDRGRGTVSSCRWDSELPANSFAGGSPAPEVHLRQRQGQQQPMPGAHNGF